MPIHALAAVLLRVIIKTNKKTTKFLVHGICTFCLCTANEWKLGTFPEHNKESKASLSLGSASGEHVHAFNGKAAAEFICTFRRK